jgi:hypothetical protein
MTVQHTRFSRRPFQKGELLVKRELAALIELQLHLASDPAIFR